MKSNFVDNLKLLASKYSQKDVAVKTGFSGSSVNNYISGANEPSISFLIALKEAFDINVNDFLFGNYETKESEMSDKFVGNYIVYYYNNTSYKGEVHNNITNTLNYGVLSIYFDDGRNLKSCATFLKNKKDAIKLLAEVGKVEDSNKMIDLHKNYNNFYIGSLHSNVQNMFIQLTNNVNGDESFLIFNNPPTMINYIGGIGTVNSVSRGREQNPCVQYILISKNLIDRSDGEIYSCLQLDLPVVELTFQTKELINLIKRLYLDKDKLIDNLTEVQKENLVENNIKYMLSEIVDANMFRFAKVSNREDDKLYRILREGASID